MGTRWPSFTHYWAAKRVPSNQAQRVPTAAHGAHEGQQRGARGGGRGEGEEPRSPASERGCQAPVASEVKANRGQAGRGWQE